MRVLKGTKVVEQAVKIPWTLDRRGRYVIMPKDQMRSEGISSPDIWDTYCFFAFGRLQPLPVITRATMKTVKSSSSGQKRFWMVVVGRYPLFIQSKK